MASQEALTNTLLAACRADPNAEQQLNQWKTGNYAEFAHALAVEIGSSNRPPEARQMAALYLKNLLYAKSLQFLQRNLEQWKSLDGGQRGRIKAALLESLACTEPTAAHAAALAASEIAAIELPHNEWPQFVPTIMELFKNSSESIKIACLDCLGYTAERIAELESILNSPPLSVETIDKMLTTIVDGAQANKSDPMRLAALTALRNSLIFVRKNMELKNERDFIMNGICEATQSAEPRVRMLAFECMDNIAEYYYDKIQDYMTAIYQLTTHAIQNDTEDSVKMGAIEFWGTIAFAEQALLDEERDCLEAGVPLDRPPCPKYTQSAMERLVPLLLDTLSHQDEDVDDEIWNLQAAGSVCLDHISGTVEALIVPIVMPFVERNITDSNWRLRDAAIVAFSSILEGPSTNVIGGFVSQAIPVLLGAFNDAHVVVRDSATHCISKICRLHISAVSSDMIHNIIQGLIVKLQEPSPRVASHACFAIFNIAHATKWPQNRDTNILSAPMLPLLQELLRATDREDAGEGNLRVSAMSAAGELIQAAGLDCQPIFRDFLPVVIQRMDAALKVQVVSKDDVETKEQVLGSLCALIQVLFQRLGKEDILPHVDLVMELLLQVLQARSANCHEEAFLASGAIVVTMEADFVKYLPIFAPLVVNGLRSIQERGLCIVSVGVVVDLCSAVGGAIQPYCDDIMGALRESLMDASVSRDIKPVVISCFGDVAWAIGKAYEPYLQVSVMMLMQASQQSAPPDDEDLIIFINQLRLSILEAYSGIIMGLADGDALDLIVSHVPAIMQFLQVLSSEDSNRDEEVLTKAVALIGDIAHQMGRRYPQVRQQINQPFVVQLIQAASTIDDPDALQTVAWSQNHVNQVLQQS